MTISSSRYGRQGRPLLEPRRIERHLLSPLRMMMGQFVVIEPDWRPASDSLTASLAMIDESGLAALYRTRGTPDATFFRVASRCSLCDYVTPDSIGHLGYRRRRWRRTDKPGV